MPDSEIVSRYQALKKKALDEARAEAMTIEGTAREV
jgi:hypothetical protein